MKGLTTVRKLLWAVWLIGFTATAAVALEVPTRALPPHLAPLFDPLVGLAIGVFGVLGVVIGFMEHRIRQAP
jgi:hypothetical protein